MAGWYSASATAWQSARDASDHLGRVPRAVGGVARIDPFRAERQEEVLAHCQAGALEGRQHDLPSGAGIRGAFQDDGLTPPQPLLHRLGGRHDEADVRVLELGERRRHADRDSVRLRQALPCLWSR